MKALASGETAGLAGKEGPPSVCVAARMPAVMLFIPCHGGISHHPTESISRDWAEKGLRVLAEAVIETANAPVAAGQGRLAR